MHISFQLLCRHFLQSLKPLDLENSSERTGLVAEKCLLSDVIADAVGKLDVCVGRRVHMRFTFLFLLERCQVGSEKYPFPK